MRRGLIFCLILSTFPFAGCKNSSTTDSSSGGPGGAAKDYLTATTYSSLVIEIQPVTTYAPLSGSQSALVGFLNTYLNKPGGISVHVDTPISAPDKTSYSLDDVR